MDSLKEGAIITSVTIGGYMILKYLFKMSPPSAKLDINAMQVSLVLGFVRWSAREELCSTKEKD